jgi:cell shape-determining protein MreC
MTRFDSILAHSSAWRRRLLSSEAALACVLFIAVVLANLPPQSTSVVREIPRSLLQPAQTILLQGRLQANQLAARFYDQSSTQANLQAQQAALERLQVEKTALEDALRVALSQERTTAPDVSTSPSPVAPLLVPDLLEAQVLGQQARAWLAPSDILALPSAARVTAGALLLRDPVLVDPLVLLDAGRDLGITTSQRVLAGGHVWGRIDQVGPRTATVRRVTDTGYRDLVRLAQPAGPRVRFGPRGVLEGTGEPLCKIRLVKITDAVSEGDLVYTASEEGLTPLPLLYGHVVRVERQPGANHWEIWVQPAAFHGANEPAPSHLSVVRGVLNPERLARQPVTEK